MVVEFDTSDEVAVEFDASDEVAVESDTSDEVAVESASDEVAVESDASDEVAVESDAGGDVGIPEAPDGGMSPESESESDEVEEDGPTEGDLRERRNRDLLDELAEAEELWLSQGLGAYEWEVAQGYYGTLHQPNYNVRAVVRDGTVETLWGGTYFEEPEARLELSQALPWHTIPGFFERLRDEVERDPDVIEFEFDEVFGYPTQAWIDSDVDLFDDESEFLAELISLEPPTPEEVARAELREERLSDIERAELAWSDHHITTYEWRVRLSAFSLLDDAPYNVRAIVRNGEVEALWSGQLGEEAETPEPKERALGWHTIPGFFQRLREEAEGDPDTMTIEYDSQLDYPARVYIDRDVEWTDDEFQFDADIVSLEPTLAGDAGVSE